MVSRQATAHIDLDAVAHNFSYVSQLAPSSQIMAIIKADAYGHGAIRVAKKLKDADAFGVARVSEAVKLREAGIGTPICLLEGVMDKEELTIAGIYELQVVVHSEYQLDLMAAQSARRSIWLKVDSGMGRLGIRIEDLPNALKKLGRKKLLGLMTHLANAGETNKTRTESQIDRIKEIAARLPFTGADVLSIANSAGIIQDAGSRTQWVRPGLMLYGASPLDSLQTVDELHPAMSFSAPVISIRQVKQGESVGYGSIWTAEKDSRVAVIAVGYADGYPRETRQGTPVLINGNRRGLVGRVSMDMICVRLEDEDQVAPGDRAVLWGEGLPVEEIAGCAGTIAYTLLSGVAPRVSRVYRERM